MTTVEPEPVPAEEGEDEEVEPVPEPAEEPAESLEDDGTPGTGTRFDPNTGEQLTEEE